jgi:phosphocarrier protein
MKRAKVKVNNPLGMHARVAYRFASMGERFSSNIKVGRGTQIPEANGKDIMDILGLGVGRGSTLVIEAVGEDEKDAVDSLVELVNSLGDKGG